MQSLYRLFLDSSGADADLAATIYHHLGVPLDTTYNDLQGRPRFIVENGEVIRELL